MIPVEALRKLPNPGSASKKRRKRTNAERGTPSDTRTPFVVLEVDYLWPISK